MNPATRLLASAAILAASAGGALAHPGHHEGLGFAELGSHLFASADHVMLGIATLVALGGMIGVGLAKVKARK